MKTRGVLIILIVCLSLVLLGSPALAYVTKQIDKMSPKLSGQMEVPPNASTAGGQVAFTVSPDASSIHFRVIVNNLANITMADIHLAPVGVSGPMVITLYAGPLILGPFSGILAEGNITAADLTGPLGGHPLSDLDIAMDAGNTYVNVCTTQYPGGEIRDQIVAVPGLPGQSNLSIMLMLLGFGTAVVIVAWRRKLAYQRR